jgi:hypothetical protein
LQQSAPEIVVAGEECASGESSVVEVRIGRNLTLVVAVEPAEDVAGG